MTRLNKEDWISRAFEFFAEEGIGAVRVEPLAAALGVSKGSFYWHFKNRDALFTEMLDAWEHGSTLDIIDIVNASSDDPETRLRTLGEIVFRPTNFDRVEANMRVWGASYQPAAERCTRVDKKRIRYVVGLLEDLGLEKKIAQARADLMYLVLIGNTTRLNSGGKPMTKIEKEQLLLLLLS